MFFTAAGHDVLRRAVLPLYQKVQQRKVKKTPTTATAAISSDINNNNNNNINFVVNVPYDMYQPMIFQGKPFVNSFVFFYILIFC